MKTIFFIIVLLISIFGFNKTKADTIQIHLPVSDNYFSCEDTNNFNTFVIHKHPAYNSDNGLITWYLEGVSIGYGDSITYTPDSIGSFLVSARWNGNEFGVLFFFYSEPPAHTNFYTNAHTNITRDTIWYCDESVEIWTNTTEPSQGITEANWTGPNDFYSTQPSINIDTEGIYVVERSNPCGTTRDTVEVIKLPTELPDIQDLYLFCNQDVDLTLDVGPGWDCTWHVDIYQIPSQEIHITQQGTHILEIENFCVDHTYMYFDVEQQEYPLPDLQQYVTHDLIMCADSVIVLDPAPGHTYDTYLWRRHDGGVFTNIGSNPTLEFSGEVYGGGGSGIYLDITQGSCTESASGSFQTYYVPENPEICVVSVDPTLTKNEIIWESGMWEVNGEMVDFFYNRTDSYNVYKWTGGDNWSLLGNVPVQDDHRFVDVSSTPPMSSARYKITAVDQCGVESEKSYYHQTILLSVMQGSNPNEVPLIWTEYKDESGEFVVSQYHIYRGTSMENLEYHYSTPFTSYNDTGVTEQMFYQIVVEKEGGCNPIYDPNNNPDLFPKGTKTIVAGSYSNITNNITNSIDQKNQTKINIYPNPSSGIFQIEGQISSIEVFDNLGRLILNSFNQNTVDLTSFGQGIYHAKIQTANGPAANVKLIVQ